MALLALELRILPEIRPGWITSRASVTCPASGSLHCKGPNWQRKVSWQKAINCRLLVAGSGAAISGIARTLRRELTRASCRAQPAVVDVEVVERIAEEAVSEEAVATEESADAAGVVAAVLERLEVEQGVPVRNQVMEYVPDPKRSPLASCGIPELAAGGESACSLLVNSFLANGTDPAHADIAAATILLMLGGLDEANNITTSHSLPTPTTYGGQPKLNSRAYAEACYCQVIVHRMEGEQLGKFGAGFSRSDFWINNAFLDSDLAIFPALRDAAEALAKNCSEAKAAIRAMGALWEPRKFNRLCADAMMFEDPELLAFCQAVQGKELRLLFDHSVNTKSSKLPKANPTKQEKKADTAQIAFHSNGLPTYRLNDGSEMPQCGFGTYRMTPREPTKSAVSTALQVGYRMIDTAQCYENEADVGQAIAESNISRDNVFVTSKVWMDNYQYTAALESGRQSAQKAGLGYLDLMLLHAPGDRMIEAYDALLELQELGITRSVGVANFGIPHLEALRAAGRPPPAVNQIEMHPVIYLQRDELVEYCRRHGILVQAYGSLCSGEAKALGHPALQSVAQSRSVNPAQVLLRWGLDRGFGVIPKSMSQERMDINKDIFDFSLTEDELRSLEVNMWSSIGSLGVYWNPVESVAVQSGDASGHPHLVKASGPRWDD